jgi:hypothetical protein
MSLPSSRSKNKPSKTPAWKHVALLAGLLLSLFFGPEDGGDIPPKHRLTFDGPHGVISQKIELFR